jgi:hypothetical protein
MIVSTCLQAYVRPPATPLPPGDWPVSNAEHVADHADLSGADADADADHAASRNRVDLAGLSEMQRMTDRREHGQL